MTELAARILNEPFGRGEQAKPGDGKFAGDDEDDHPRGYFHRGVGIGMSRFNEGNERRTGQDFIGERIHQNAEIRDQPSITRDFAIEKIGDAREVEQ